MVVHANAGLKTSAARKQLHGGSCGGVPFDDDHTFAARSDYNSSHPREFTPSLDTPPYLGGAQLVSCDPGLVQDPAGDLAVAEVGLPEETGSQSPEVVHKVGVGALGGEAGAADPHCLQDTWVWTRCGQGVVLAF